MWVIRLVVTVVAVVLILLIGVPAHVLTWLIRKFDTPKR